MKRRLIATLLLSVFLLSALSFVSVPAAVAETPAATVTVSKEAADPGDTVTLSVTLSENPGIMSAYLQVNYDEDLTLLSCTNEGLLGTGDVYLASSKLTANPYHVSWDNSENGENITANGKLISLTFKVAADATGELPVTVTYTTANVINKDLEDVQLTNVAGGVTIKQYAKITTQPKSVTVAKGKTAKVSLKATGDGLTYTWYYKNPGSSKFSKTTSFTGNSYSISMDSSRHGRQVYCVVKDKYGNTEKSSTATLKMEQYAKITTQPKSVTVAKNKTAKVTVKATGDSIKYTWYVKNAGSSKFSKSSVTKSTYSVTMTSKVTGRQVYCVVTDKYGKTAKSSTVTLKMEQYAKITTHPKTVTVAKNKTAKVTVKATGDGIKYTWYTKNAGSSKFSKSSVTKSTYSVKMTSKVKGRQVYCVVTDKYGNKAKSKTATLKMK